MTIRPFVAEGDARAVAELVVRCYARWGWRPDGAEQELWPGVVEVRLSRKL